MVRNLSYLIIKNYIMKKKLESIKKVEFGKLKGLNTSCLAAIRGGAQTKTKGAKTKEATADHDSAASQENPGLAGT